MESLTPSWILVFLGLGCIILELVMGAATGFDLLLIGSCLMVGGITGNLTGKWETGMVVAIILALLYLLVGRKFVKKSLTITTQATNTDRLIGKTGTVTKAIGANKAGQVKVGAEVWRGVSDHSLKEGTSVTVTALEGVSVIVVES